MRVGLDLTATELDATGTARVLRSLRDRLARHEGIDLVELRQGGRRRRGRAGTLVRGLGRELVYLPLVLPARARRLGLDILHCQVGALPVRPPAVTVVTVHDVMALHHPEWFTRANVWQQRLVMRRALPRAARVMASSTFTRDDLLAHVELDPERVDVVPLAVDEHFSAGPPDERLLAEVGADAPYVLAVGTLQPRKNLEAALAAFERLVASGLEHRLVVAGGRGWHDTNVVARLERSPAAARVVLTGQVSEETLLTLYRGADVFVYPSRFEGFGLPPLEAMACGTPVVCSGRTSLPEVVGDAALLADPEDPASFADAIARVLGSLSLAERLRELGRARAAYFTWSRSVKATIASYERALTASPS